MAKLSIRVMMNFFSRPNILIVGFALISFLWALSSDLRNDWVSIDYIGYFRNTCEGFLLLIIATGLLFRKSYLNLFVVIFLSGWVLYGFTIDPLLRISSGLNVPMVKALEYWWEIVVWNRPRIMQIGVVAVVFSFAFISLLTLIWSRRIHNGV